MKHPKVSPESPSSGAAPDHRSPGPLLNPDVLFGQEQKKDSSAKWVHELESLGLAPLDKETMEKMTRGGKMRFTISVEDDEKDSRAWAQTEVGKVVTLASTLTSLKDFEGLASAGAKFAPEFPRIVHEKALIFAEASAEELLYFFNQYCVGPSGKPTVFDVESLLRSRLERFPEDPKSWEFAGDVERQLAEGGATKKHAPGDAFDMKKSLESVRVMYEKALELSQENDRTSHENEPAFLGRTKTLLLKLAGVERRQGLLGKNSPS